MEIKSLIENLNIPKEKVFYNEPMKNHTTFKIGGPAKCLIKIDSVENLKEILKIANKHSIQITIIGNGSNILVQDKGIQGITLMIKLEKIQVQEINQEIQVTVGAGEKLGKLARNMLSKRNNRVRRIIWNTRNNRWGGKNECRSPW